MPSFALGRELLAFFVGFETKTLVPKDSLFIRHSDIVKRRKRALGVAGD